MRWAGPAPPRWPFAALALTAFLAAALTLDDPGVTWDEPGYLDSARLEVSWLAALPARAAAGDLRTWVSADTLAAYWHANPYINPHPPFYKILAGIGWATLHGALGDFAAFRISSAALFGVTVGAVGLWTASASASIPAGLAAGLALGLMPRVFGDAHVAATDMPLAAFWCLAAFAFWNAVRGGRLRHALAFGAFWGMALATKFNALLLPAPLALWGLAHARRASPRALAVGGALALLLMVLLNPWLWPDPLGRTLAFVAQSTSRADWAPISTWYLGRVHGFVLPWHHSLVLTLVTVPLPILALAAAGAARLREPAARPLVSMCLIQIGFQQLLMALPSSPNHDGVRLFLPQFPFLGILAGLGFGWAWRRVGDGARDLGRLAPAAARSALVALAFGPPAAATLAAHPLELAWYNEVTGGARGAYARGFETTYWFDAATPDFLRALERRVPHGARVWASPAPYHFRALQREGLLREDIEFTGSLPAPFLLLMTRQGTFGPFHWRLHRKVEPLETLALDGVPLMALYQWR